MIYGYIRVSTDRQDTKNQKFEISNFAKRNDMVVEEWIEETISSTKTMDKRKLGNLLKKMKKGDIMIASEISRIGRNLMQIMSVLHDCMNREIMVWTIKDNFRLGNDIQSKVLAFAFGLSAEIERNLISQRTKEALARKKAEGVILGRPLGSKTGNLKLTGKEEQIKKLLKNKISFSAIGRIVGAHRLTVASFCEENNLLDNTKKKRVPPKVLKSQPKKDYSGIFDLYKNGMSFLAAAKEIGIDPSGLRTRMIKEGTYQKILEIHDANRIAHPSKRSLQASNYNERE